MIPSALQDIKVTAYEFMYSLAISTDKSQELAKKLLLMKLGKRRITFSEARKMATIYSDVFIEKMSSFKEVPTGDERSEVQHEMLDRAAEIFKEDNNG